MTASTQLVSMSIAKQFDKGVLCNRALLPKYNFGDNTFGSDLQRSEHVEYAYLPTNPPRLTKPLVLYKRSVQSAPYHAIEPRRLDALEFPPPSKDGRYRIRNQVGTTNRWRVSFNLSCDLLGSAQAIKAITESRENMIRSQSSLSLPASKNQQTPLDSARQPSEPINSFLPPMESRPGTGETAATLDKSGGGTKIHHIKPKHNSHSSPEHSLDATPSRVVFQESFSLDLASILQEPADVLMSCLGAEWLLHSATFKRAGALRTFLGPDDTLLHVHSLRGVEESRFIAEGDKPVSTQYKNVICIERFGAKLRSWEALCQERSSDTLSTAKRVTLKHGKHTVTKKGLAVALGNLYTEEISLLPQETADVLPAAKMLQFDALEDKCLSLMVSSIAASNVCVIHAIGLDYKLPFLTEACETWLQNHVITEMSSVIQIKHLSTNLLMAVLVSNKLFVDCEFSLFKLLASWLFYRLQPKTTVVQTFPSIITYFQSLPKYSALLDREEYSQYLPLFSLLRLHGISDPAQLELIQRMNILPTQWLLKLLATNYRALQGGGDMSLLMSFDTSAIRQGFVINKVDEAKSEIVSLHGFYFEISAAPDEHVPTSFCFLIKRLKPTDPVLSYGSKERYTFSMKQDREMLYSISARWQAAIQPGKNQFEGFDTGMKRQRFGFGSKLNKSEVFLVEGMAFPAHITFHMLFPPS